MDEVVRQMLHGIVLNLERVRRDMLSASEVYLGHCACRSSGVVDDLEQAGRVFTLLDPVSNRLLLDRLVDRYAALGSERLARTTDPSFRALLDRLARLRARSSDSWSSCWSASWASQEGSAAAGAPRRAAEPAKEAAMPSEREGPSWPEDVSRLLDEILTDAHGDDEQLWALRQAFEDGVRLLADAFVIGEPVEVVEIDYDGNTRGGLTARCRRQDGGEHVVAASELAFPEGSDGARRVAAYRKWLGLEPLAAASVASTRGPKRHKAADHDLDLDAPIELVVLAPKERAARCRIFGTEREITLRSGDVWNIVPGEIVAVRARKQWRYAGHPYLSGDVESHRLDVAALGLGPGRGRALGAAFCRRAGELPAGFSVRAPRH